MPDVPATRIVVKSERLKEILSEKGLRNWEEVRDKSRELGSPISLQTLYSILGNGNFQRRSIETLAEVLGVSLEEFVEFQPAA